ncbi:hypothetical protein Glo7428_3026 [Gloeocapsa sp. PCC 7428]|uniref:hypothetical protein n=1 Tax=Gloeocapsa sp. PCC 7428 TaxID=1173026 RepID=UPI0002A5FEE5|nr:hypothetical protein [Gloeocapsa sp. PCC 7428]AFZ31515.1 hypothetical protein Glo7428_3026 [Gloeocapsa sp. PCC 7428]
MFAPKVYVIPVHEREIRKSSSLHLTRLGLLPDEDQPQLETVLAHAGGLSLSSSDFSRQAFHKCVARNPI